MTIHRIFLAIAAAIAVVFSTHAITPSEAFVSAPSDVIPLLDRNVRLDMLDYFNAGVDVPSYNITYGLSRVTALDPYHIAIELTSTSRMDIVTMPLDGDTVITVIHTFDTPVPDSKVALFSSAWEPLGPKAFSAPDIKEWLRRDAGRKALDEVDAYLPLMLYSCTFDPRTLSFVFTNTTPEFMGEEAYEPLKPLLRDYIVYAFEIKSRRLTPLSYDAGNPLK